MLADRYGEFVVKQASGAGGQWSVVSGQWSEQITNRQSSIDNRQSSNPNPESRTPYPVSLVPSLDVQIVPLGQASDADELRVRRENGLWVMERGDFRAEYDRESGRGRVRQSLFPYAIDGVLRILHSLILAREGGFLVHAASAVRHGRAYVFAGLSGAGKTTISRLAPPDVTLLTDEISYVRETGYGSRETGHGIRGTGSTTDMGNGPRERGNGKCPGVSSPVSRTPNPVSRDPAFLAYGTPFAGELARLGKKLRAPLAALFLLQQGPENRLEPVSAARAARELMRHVLFFAEDQELVGAIFETVCKFVQRVPVRRLVFTPDPRVWELIGD
jgi:hypothetical protein